jgi:hypothetical protein
MDNYLLMINIETQEIELIEPKGSVIPPPRAGGTLTFVPRNQKQGSDKLYLFGGTDGSGVVHNDFYVFDLESRSWSNIFSDREGPCAREGHSMNVWRQWGEGKVKSCFLVLYGGSQGYERNHRKCIDIWLFDIGNFFLIF